MQSFFFLLHLNPIAAEELIELRESFGPTDNPTVVPYYHPIDRVQVYQSINQSVGKKGYGPRTYVSADVHTLLNKTFQDIAAENLKLSYGEGSWGSTHAKTALTPHRTHKNGLYLDIFMPIQDATNIPVYFPNGQEDLFGYAVNFNPAGQGEGDSQPYHIDWSALITLFASLCTHGEDNIKKVLIAQDFIPTLQSETLQAQWAKIPESCRQKLVPIEPIGPYKFAGQEMMVDHDDHIHIEFHH